MLKPGFEWDPIRRIYRPVDYLSMSEEELKDRRENSSSLIKETEAQLKALAPVVDAQALLNKSSSELMDLFIKLAKKAPSLLASVI